MAHPTKADGDTVTHTEWNAQDTEFRAKVTRFQKAGPFLDLDKAWNNEWLGTITPDGTYSAILGIYASFEMAAGYVGGGTDFSLARLMITNMNNSGHSNGNKNVVTGTVSEGEEEGTIWVAKTIYSALNDGDQDHEDDNTEQRQCYFPCGASLYNLYMQTCGAATTSGAFTTAVPEIRNLDAYVYWLDSCYLITEKIP